MFKHSIILAMVVLLVILSTACTTTLTPTSTPTAQPDQGQSVTFETQDGVQIAGTLFGTGKTAVILAHQGGSSIDPDVPVPDQTSWREFALTLAENGFTALTFDFRGLGESGGYWGYTTLNEDVRAAVNYLQSQQYNRIVCVGASMGGTACLRVAIDDGSFIGLITLASPLVAGYNDQVVLPEELDTLTLPKLFITGEDDFTTVVRDTKKMYELSPEPKKLVLLQAHEHGTDLFFTSVGQELSTTMLDFLRELPTE
jgi:alpha/beta superfamily hydrolase